MSSRPQCSSPATRPENDLRSKRRATTAAAVLFLFCAAFVVYQPCFKGGLILDDDIYITATGLLPAPDGLHRVWFSREQAEYYPITYTALWFEWRLWGLNPAGYRIINVLLHISAALLLWTLLRKLSIPGAYLAALLFLLHPVNVESVAWLFQIRGVLAMVFSIVSILCYLNASRAISLEGATKADAEPPRVIFPFKLAAWYCLSLLTFLLAMLCKGSVAILPLVLLLIGWWRQRRITPGDLVRTAPYFFLSVVLSNVNLWFQTRGAASAVRSAGIVERLADAATIVWFYLSKAVAPIHLLLIYPQWQKSEAWLWWLPLLAAMVVTALLLWQRNSRWGRPLLFAWGLFWVTLAPVLGLADLRYMKFSMVANHYEYIALAAVAALAGAGWSVWHRRVYGITRTAVKAIAAATLAGLMFLAWHQSRLFGDPTALYRTTVEGNPDCWMIQNFLGNELAHAGRSQEAIECYQQALRVNPNFPGAHANLGFLLALAGQPEAGIAHLQEALRLDSNLEEAHNSLGMILVRLGQIPSAIEHYHQALLLKPDFVEAWANLALADAKLDRSDEALYAAGRALEIATSHDQLALAQQIETWLKSYRAQMNNPAKGTGVPDSPHE